MYQFTDEFSHTHRFHFRKKYIKNFNWARLSTAAQAIYPVLACYAKKSGIAFPSEETISDLAGITAKVVRKGIKDFASFPGFSWRPYTTKRGRRSKKFYFDLPEHTETGETFPFFQYVLESGSWSELLPTARALYPVMRYFGYFDIESYMELEEGDYEAKDFNEIFESRTWDICEAEKTVMAEYAGIDRTSIDAALKSLKHCCLVEPLPDRPGWKVFLKSNGMIFKRDFLNKKRVSKKYRS